MKIAFPICDIITAWRCGMSEFYYMREFNVGLLVFACLVNVTMLLGTLSNRKKK